MKRAICFVFAFVFLFCLYGCDQEADILFFYPRAEVQYGSADGVIASESRSIDSDGRDLSYLLKLYLEGPISQELRSPFPRGTTMESLSFQEGRIVIVLSQPFSELENLDYMISCACIASTCFALTEADSVTVEAGGNTLTLTRDNLVLEDQTAVSIPQ